MVPRRERALLAAIVVLALPAVLGAVAAPAQGASFAYVPNLSDASLSQYRVAGHGLLSPKRLCIRVAARGVHE